MSNEPRSYWTDWGSRRTERTPVRRALIDRTVENEGHVSVAELAVRLAVSEVTIRKDLEALGAQRHLVRTRGGATSLISSDPEASFGARERLNRREKLSIGRSAASLVKDGETIALDASTTAFYVGRALRGMRSWHHLTVVTNGLRAAHELAGLRGIEVWVPAGQIRGESLSIVGGEREGSWPPVIDRAFFGASALTVEFGLGESTEAEAAAKRRLVAQARQVIAVVDHTKWGRAGTAWFCPISRVSLVVTDSGATSGELGSLAGNQVKVQLAHHRADA